MMKRATIKRPRYEIVLIVAIILGSSALAVILFAQPTYELWQRVWNPKNSSSTQGGVWSDGTNIYTCGTSSYPHLNTMILVKWDSSGNQIWNRTWNFDNYSEGWGIWGSGKRIYTCGEIAYYNLTRTLAVVCWDSDGNLVWNRTWGGPTYSTVGGEQYSISGNGTSIYTCATISNETSPYYTSILLVKWDSNGNIMWNRTWGGSNYEYGGSVWCNSSAIYTCGETTDMIKPSIKREIVLIKWDAMGNQIWNRTWDPSNDSIGYSVCSSGSYIYLGGSVVVGWNPNGLHGHPIYSMVLLKCDSNGNLLWNRTANQGCPYPGCSIYCAGANIYTSQAAALSLNSIIVKWDAAGNEVWSTSLDTYYVGFYHLWANETSIYSVNTLYPYGLELIRWSSTPIPKYSVLDGIQGGVVGGIACRVIAYVLQRRKAKQENITLKNPKEDGNLIQQHYRSP